MNQLYLKKDLDKFSDIIYTGIRDKSAKKELELKHGSFIRQFKKKIGLNIFLNFIKYIFIDT